MVYDMVGDTVLGIEMSDGSVVKNRAEIDRILAEESGRAVPELHNVAKPHMTAQQANEMLEASIQRRSAERQKIADEFERLRRIDPGIGFPLHPVQNNIFEDSFITDHFFPQRKASAYKTYILGEFP